MGPLSGLVGMLPMVPKEVRNVQLDDSMLKPVEAIIRSMTPAERADPALINGSRRSRIAAGSGTTVQEVNELLERFKQVQVYMRQMPGLAGAAARRSAGKKTAAKRKSGGKQLGRGFRSLTPVHVAYTYTVQDQLATSAPAQPRALTGRGNKGKKYGIKLRLMRMGKTKQPTYRLVAADSRSPRDGRFIEIVGSYAPRQQENKVVLKEERVTRWLRKAPSRRTGCGASWSALA